ncbi:MAG TPA: hypothetical protein VGG20_17785 [Thermoanaerobaculia bacterium]
MLQRFLRSPLVSMSLALSLASCASAPPAAGPASVAKANSPTSKALETRSVNLLCHEGARAVRFDKAGVPSGERPVDVALNRKSIWVLFNSGRVLQLSRGGERLDVQMHFLPSQGDTGAIAVDPVDDSVWVVSQASLDLYRFAPEGQMSTVKLKRKVEGAGGFAGLILTRESIYAQPTCADSAVWRLDRSGKFLGTAFNAPAKTESDLPVIQVNGPGESPCYSVRLERDAQGHVLAWDRLKKATYQVDDDGNWTPSESPLFAQLKAQSSGLNLKGVDVGERSEQWYFTGAGGNLFYWKGQPVFLGSYTIKEKTRGSDTVLNLPGENGSREVIMTCRGFPVRRVATDATGYAALTGQFLVLGEMANAPDLP